ncbi:MAG: 50S ribosomal protein L29 [Planctomycetota bacterium]|nr:50S ribosomal protein L29 [Planctomycetota bacterium]MDA1215150.1 50S ribosomal protein L29 [Planctomycetota bacterium]
MTIAKELREQSSDQLEFNLKEQQQQLFKLRLQAATEKLDAPSNLRNFRREIARIKTILHQRSTESQPAT